MMARRVALHIRIPERRLRHAGCRVDDNTADDGS
jgi:hypothetical protein